MMGCNDSYCEIEKGIKPCPKCGKFPFIKVNNLTAWIKCYGCGRCAVGGSKDDAVKNWNKEDNNG